MKRNGTNKVRFRGMAIVFGALALMSATLSSHAADLRVDGALEENGDGSTWEEAFAWLQDAITAAGENDRIWVAAGTYRPDEDENNPNGSGSREASFVAKNDVRIYGGFDTSDGAFSDRDPLTNITILSGDLDQNDNVEEDEPFHEHYGENSYHVTDGRTATNARFEGFTIMGGHASYGGAEPDERKHGGGAITGKGVFYVNCIFKYNTALNGGPVNLSNSGGAISGWHDDGVMVYNCTFLLNVANKGGAIAVYESEDVQHIVNCEFNLNLAASDGGAIRVTGRNEEEDCHLEVDDCTIYDNYAYAGGGLNIVCHGHVTIQNSILWANKKDLDPPVVYEQIQVDTFNGASVTVAYCDIQDGWAGTGNIDDDPEFVDAAEGMPLDDDLHILGGGSLMSPLA